MMTAVLPMVGLLLLMAGGPCEQPLAAAEADEASAAPAAEPVPRESPAVDRDAYRQQLRDLTRWSRGPMGSDELLAADGQLAALLAEYKRLAAGAAPLAAAECRYWQRIVGGRLQALARRLRASPVARAGSVAADRPTVLAQLGGAAAGGNQPADDDGRRLAELIERVIAPDSWESRGGRGVIVFWPHHHGLVVRQTGDQHQQLGELLNQLRN